MKVGSVLAKQPVVRVASPRIPSLDGLRALSITLVCVAHFAYAPGFPIRHNLLLDVYAHFGVRIFFVISGYLITTLLIREQKETGTINIKQFFIRRAYRVLPVAYVYLVVMTVVFHKSLTASDLAIAYTYLCSYALHLPWVLSHLWSLSVEEQFYLIWPVAMAFSFTLARRLAFAALVFAPLIRFASSKLGLSMGAVYFFPSVTDSLAAGCLLAMFQPRLERHRSFFTGRWFPLIWAFTMSIPVLHHYSHVVQVSSFSAYNLGAMIFNLGVVLCVQNAIVARPRLLNAPIIVWIGTLSYSLYIWQMPFTNWGVQSWATTFPQNLMLALLAAAVSYYAVERPVLRLRDRRARPSPPFRLRATVDVVDRGPFPDRDLRERVF